MVNERLPVIAAIATAARAVRLAGVSLAEASAMESPADLVSGPHSFSLSDPARDPQ
jgi:hypothetical protein